MKKRIFIIFTLGLMIFSIQKVNAMTETENISQYSATIKYKAIGEFKEDNKTRDYYSQEYETYTDNLEILSYEIREINGFPDGSFIVNANTNQRQSKFARGENRFKVMVPIEKASEDFIGKMKIYMEFKTLVHYYTKDKEINCMEVNDSNKQIKELDNRQSKIDINIMDKETLEPIKGVKIEVNDTKFQTNERHISNAYGRINIEKIGEGEAIINILEIPNDYNIEKLEYSKEIGYGEIVSYNIKLEHKKGILLIKNNAIGSMFEVYNDKGSLIGKYITNKEGIIEIEKLNTGNYLLIQKSVPSKYMQTEDIKFKIEDDETNEIEIINEIKEWQENEEKPEQKPEEIEKDPVEDEKGEEEKTDNEENEKTEDEEIKEDKEEPEKGEKPDDKVDDNKKEEQDTTNKEDETQYKEENNKNEGSEEEENKEETNREEVDNESNVQEENCKENTKIETKQNQEEKVILAKVQDNKNENKVKVLPRTGNDYFGVKVIAVTLMVFIILVLKIISKDKLKKQTAK